MLFLAGLNSAGIAVTQVSATVVAPTAADVVVLQHHSANLRSGVSSNRKLQSTTTGPTYIAYTVTYNIGTVGYTNPTYAYNNITAQLTNYIVTTSQFNAALQTYAILDSAPNMTTVTSNTFQVTGE